MSSGLALEIPSGLSGQALIDALNDRLRTIAQELPGDSQPGVLNMNGYRITNLGDPINPQDALNLRTADARYSKLGATAPAGTNTTTTIIKQTAASSSGNGGVTLNGVPVLY